MSTDAVRVAVRVRPQNVREQAAGYQVCAAVSPSDAQIFIANDKSFTYDYAFDWDTTQIDLYDSCIRELVAGVFSGFNATVLAYGQTGSGKTYTMGTAFDAEVVPPEYVGIIPRAVEQIFDGIQKHKRVAKERDDPDPVYSVEVQFVELYNEELIDLLSLNRSQKVRVHEDPETGEIVIKNATTVPVNSADAILEALKNGVLNRTTGSTNMNQQSSRSHAIFSIHIKQEKFDSIEGSDEKILTALSAKLHFVDLAGSERLKRTGATGDRAKEGISINCGLLALGNVISALTAPKKTHVPYRDSKLTRLLQDSLGGNSRTLMIACASPNAIDMAETLNTLTYAARAKQIKNRVMVNKHHGTEIVNQLRGRIVELETELQEWRQGKLVADVKQKEEETNEKKELQDVFEECCQDVLKQFKERLDAAIGNTSEIHELVEVQEKLIDSAIDLRKNLEDVLCALKLPEKNKDRRSRRDTIFSNQSRPNKRQKRITTLVPVDEQPEENDENEKPVKMEEGTPAEDKIAKLEQELRLARERAENAERAVQSLKAEGQSQFDEYQRVITQLKEEMQNSQVFKNRLTPKRV